MRGWWLLICPVFVLAASPDFRVERRPVAGGAEFLTVFGRVPDATDEIDDIPLVTVLRDTLGDQADVERQRVRAPFDGAVVPFL